MNSSKLKILTLLVSTVLVLGFIVIFTINKSGETLSVIAGKVQRCETLGGAKAESLPHATIKTEKGVYIAAALRNCKSGASVNVFTKRGSLYFNTVYFAERT